MKNEENECVTGLFYNEQRQCIWITYTWLYPECILNIDKSDYVRLLSNISEADRKRYDIYAKLFGCQ